MSIKLLKKYIDYCDIKGVKPTFEGLKLWMNAIKHSREGIC